MARAFLRLYAELNDHIPVERRQSPFVHDFDCTERLEDVMKSIGVPSGEVDLILVNGQSVGLSHLLRDGDRVSLYPVFETFDISAVTRVRSFPLRQTRFVLDVHLGKLAAHLRMLGFDTLYRNTCTDDELLIISNHEKRILLSKDRDLLNDTRLMRGYRVRANDPTLQLSEVMRRFDLYTSIMPFQRCLRCNSMLRLVPREEVVHRLPEKVRQSFDEFHYCDTCTRVYWKGGHYHRMQAFIWTLLRQADA